MPGCLSSDGRKPEKWDATQAWESDPTMTMTPQILEYFEKAQPVRKKEPQYLAFINRNSCTSCTSCASMCPVDCIYEVSDAPGQSYHQIDTARCIGCQMCYRVPSESTGPWTMEICPWNAIDMTFNPNFAEKNAAEKETVWESYFAGAGSPPNFKKLEELGYQLYLNRSIYVKKGSDFDKMIESFVKSDWTYGEGNFAIVKLREDGELIRVYDCTSEGDNLVDFLYRDYKHMFLD